MNTILQNAKITHTDINTLITECNNKLDKTANAASSSKWINNMKLTLTGDVTGSVSFNGSAAVSLTATVVDDSHNHTIANIDNLQTSLNAKANSSNPSLSYPLSNGYSAVFRRAGGEDAYSISIVVDDANGNRKFYSLYNSSDNTFLPLERVNFANGAQMWVS